jgi:drug/metabolite transporter (DMT)-like permease
MAEFIKLVISICLHVADFEDHRGGPAVPLATRIETAKANFLECIWSQPMSIVHLFLLAFLYLFNNQLNFYTNGGADPGSIYLFKSGSTMITALMLWFFLGRKSSDLQWGAIFMQVAGLFVVQYDPCKGQAILPTHLYFLMGLSTCISSTTAVRNDYMLKNFKMSMHVQNIILYSCGVVLNICAFLIVPAYLTNTKAGLGFFEGYDSTPAKLVVLFNAFIGVAISFVFLYADAVIKTFATASTTVLLVVFSSVYLHQKTTVIAWMGVLVVIVATYVYGKLKEVQAVKPALPVAMQTLKEEEKEVELESLLSRDSESQKA